MAQFPWTREQTREWVHRMSRRVEVRGNLFSKLSLGLLAALVRRLSWEAADKLGEWIGRAMYRLRIRSDVALTNLDIAFGERKTAEEKERIYRDSLITLGRHVLDYLRLPNMDERFWADFETENLELVEQAYNRGKGVILTGGHIGVWEIAAGRLGMAGYPISIVAKRLGNPVVDKLILDSREGMNLGTIAHRDSMQRVFAGLHQGEGVTMAIDQNMKRSQGVFVEWMGRPASTVRSNAWVARETGAPVIVGYAYRRAPGRFTLKLGPEIPWEPCPEDPERELLVNTRNQAAAVERVILEHPELWLWIHRRFKVQPEGRENPYKK